MKKKTAQAIFGDTRSAEADGIIGDGAGELRDAAYYDEAIKRRIHEEELNRQKLSGEIYSHTGGVVFKATRILCILLTIYTLFFDFVMVLSYTFDLTDYERFSDAKNNLIIMSLITALLMVSLVLVCLKRPKTLTALLISLPTAVAQAIITYNWYTTATDSNVSKSFADGIYYKYYLFNFPVVFIPVLILILAFIVFRDRRYETRLYDRLIRRIYSENQPEDGSILTSEEWCVLLKEYSEMSSLTSAPASGSKKKKRSVRVKEDKDYQRRQRYAVTLTDPVDAICPVCRELTQVQRDTKKAICLNCAAQIDVKSAVRIYDREEAANEVSDDE